MWVIDVRFGYVPFDGFQFGSSRVCESGGYFLGSALLQFWSAWGNRIAVGLEVVVYMAQLCATWIVVGWG